MTGNNATTVPRVHSAIEKSVQTVVDSVLSVTVLPVAELVSKINSPQSVGNYIMGAVSYSHRLQATALDFPALNIELPPLQETPLVEVWSSSQRPEQGTSGSIRFSKNPYLLFGCMEAECGADLQAQTQTMYEELLEFVHASGYPHLLRIWNHFPKINEAGAGLERYRMFCIGRHNAFRAHFGSRFQLQLPAASAIGTQGTKFSLHFVAGSEAGVYLENPRQLSAYCYPEQYGPCSPSFARATLCSLGNRSQLILSGTASIVGHETLHQDNAQMQLEETLRNIDALLRHRAIGARQLRVPRFGMIKVYVRDPGDMQKIKSRVAQYFGRQAPILYLHSDICRSDLLLEIEGICDL